MNGMNFGMEGPQVTGWWYNPTTGDKFNAVDNYFEDNNLLIKTADGRLLNYNQIQNYVHVEDPKSIPDKPITTKSKKQNDEIPAEVLAEIDNGEEDGGGLLIPEDNIFGRPIKQNPSAELGNIYSGSEQVQPAIQDFAIIDRALSGKEIPNPVAQISWDEFPKREIEMLVDVMNIPEDEIVEYYINRVSIDVVKEMVAKSVREYIELSLGDKGTNTVTTQHIPSGEPGQTSSGTTEKKTTTKKKK